MSYSGQLDLSGDFAAFDNLETVNLTSVVTDSSIRTDNSKVFEITNAMRMALTAKEQAASQGAYTGSDVVFHLPKIEMEPPAITERVVPKPRDVVMDSDGTTYTVLEVGFITFKSIYRLITRDLALAFHLYDLIEIQTPRITQDAAGGKLKTWGPKYARLKARVQLLTQEIAEERLIRGFTGKYAVIVEREVAVTNEDRMLFNGQFYEIRGYRNAERLDELPVLDCDLVFP